jgi:ADP-heptose:LPS heptosyltransferase
VPGSNGRKLPVELNSTAELAGWSPRKVLILMTDRHIGNLIVSLPALAALQDYYRDIPHRFIFADGFQELVENVIDPLNTLVYPRSDIKQGNVIKRAYAYLRFLLKLRFFGADLLVDLAGSRNSGVLAKSSGTRRRIAADRAKRPTLYTDLIPLNPETHKVYDYTDIATAVGATASEEHFRFEPAADKVHKVQALLNTSGLDLNSPIVTVHIGAGRPQKLWNISGFVEVVHWLFQNGCQVIFIGAPDEARRAEDVIRRLTHPVLNLLGKISFGELLALLKLSTAYLGNDSGPMHMAAAMGVPGVAMFSYAKESEWRPRSDDFETLRGQAICEVCIKKKCLDPVCINTLDSAPVIQALAKILNRERTNLA